MRAQQTARGFTLIEMITVIVLLGIMAGILTPFLLKSMQAYGHHKNRQTLLTTGNLALERMTRAIRQAVPNSISLINGSEGIEFLHVRAGGRYIERFDNFSTAFADNNRRLLRNTPMSSIYVLGTGLNFHAGDILVIGNTSPADLGSGNSGSSVAITAIEATTAASWPTGDGSDQGQIIHFAASHLFPFDSPGKHFSIADQSIEIGKLASTLRWHSQAGLADYNQSSDLTGADPVLLDQVQAIDFRYQPGTPQASGIVRILLTLADASGQDSLRLYHEVHVRNTP